MHHFLTEWHVCEQNFRRSSGSGMVLPMSNFFSGYGLEEEGLILIARYQTTNHTVGLPVRSADKMRIGRAQPQAKAVRVIVKACFFGIVERGFFIQLYKMV